MEPIDEVRVSAVADEIVGRELCVEKVKSTGITWVQHWTDEWRKKNGQAAAKEEPEPARSPSPRPTRQTRSHSRAAAEPRSRHVAASCQGSQAAAVAATPACTFCVFRVFCVFIS